MLRTVRWSTSRTEKQNPLSQPLRSKDSPETAEPAAAAEPNPYVPGEIIADKYRLIRVLGEGGMGAVWVAKNLALDVQVALKLIRTDVDTEGADERLLTEARATARLKHPNIVRVFDFGRTRRNDPYIVMELLQGETLGEVLDREGRLSATFAVQLLLPAADALGAAHSKSVVHRDLKPDNVFLADSDGRLQPKVLDFGIAKLQLEQRDHKLTQAGTVLGSPDYMSPEQARGVEDIDHRADIWAFCVVLYECITGRVPFEDANYNALLRHIIEDDIPSILDYAAGDADLWKIMEKGFAKDRKLRYQSMRELCEQLASWLTMHGITEDVSGHSLRAAWLDPSISRPDGTLRSLTPGRLSQPSIAGFEAPFASGAYRASSGPHLLDEARPTVPPQQPQAEPARSRRPWLIGAGALVLLAALGAIAFVAGARSVPDAASTAPTTAPAPSPAQPAEPAPKAAQPKAPPDPAPSTSAPAAEAETPADDTPKKTPSSAPTRGKMQPAVRPKPTATAQPPEPPPTATAPAPPKKKSPYEDLGF